MVGRSDSDSCDPTDRELIRQIASHKSRRAMETLYCHYRQRLGGFLSQMLRSKELIEDVYNQAMMVIWQKASTYNGDAKVSTWIFSIAYRICLNQIKKEAKYSYNSNPVSEPQAIETPVNDLEIVERKQLIRKAVQQLTPEHRAAVELAYFSGHTYAEIGMITRVPESTVKTRIFYAKKHLFNALSQLQSSGAESNEK